MKGERMGTPMLSFYETLQNFLGSSGYEGTSGVVANYQYLVPRYEPEELHCEYCGRLHARGKETCSGCGAPLKLRYDK